MPADGIAIRGTALESYGDLESHIVERNPNDTISIETGTLTSVDGRSHVIKDAGGVLTIDDIDISELNALQVSNGQVHRIVWPLGEYVSVLSVVEEYGSRDPNYQGTDLRHAFYAELIRSLDETERYNDRDSRLTLAIPVFSHTAAENQQRNEGVADYYLTTMYDAFGDMRTNQSFAITCGPCSFLVTV